MTDHTRAGHHGTGHWVVMVLAIVAALIGAVLLAGGIWLIVLGGTWYYAIAGFGLIVTAAYLMRHSVLAVPVYLAVYVYTLVWAYLEVGLDWWAQVPRVIAPTVILVTILLCLPLLGSRTRPTAHANRASEAHA